MVTSIKINLLKNNENQIRSVANAGIENIHMNWPLCSDEIILP